MDLEKSKDRIKHLLKVYKTKYGNRFPRIEWLMSKSGLPEEEIKSILDRLEAEGYLKSKTDKKLKGINNFQYSEEKKAIKKVHIYFDLFISFLRRLIKKINIKSFVKVVMFSVSIATMCIEAKFDYVQLINVLNNDIFWAIVASIALPVFSVFGLESFLLLRRQYASFISIVVAFMVVLSILFSISMIVIGQYNTKIELINRVSITNQNELKKTEKLDNLNKELAILQNQVNSDQKNLDNNKIDWMSYSLTNTLNDSKKLLLVKQQEITALNNNTEIKISNQNFYEWVQINFGIKAGVAEFLIGLIFPIFCSIFSPTGMTVALGLYKIGKKKETLFTKIKILFNKISEYKNRKKEEKNKKKQEDKLVA